MTMKLTIKTLKQVAYQVEVAEEAKVNTLKEEIEKKHGFEAKSIKLLFNGVVLDDAKSLSEYGLKDGIVVMMMSAKAKPQNVIKEEKKVEEPLPSAGASKETKEEKRKSKKPFQIDNPKDYSKEVQTLVEMGFTEDLSKRAIEAAKGNLNLAIEFLYNGIPEEVPFPDLGAEEDEENSEIRKAEMEAILGDIDLNNPKSLNTLASILKVFIQDDASELVKILSGVEETNPEVIDFIKEHEAEFKSLIEKPLTEEDVEIFDRVMGCEPEEVEGNDEEDIQIIQGNAADFTGQPAHEDMEQNAESALNLTASDRESIERLKGLGFSEAEVIQAYVACDKNETIAANFLVDNKFKEDGNMNIDYDGSDFYDK